MSFTHIATRSTPIVSNLPSIFATSIFVPTPSVLVTRYGFFKLPGSFVSAPKPPIFLNLPLFFDFFVLEDINLINLSAFFMLTPLFSYVKFFDPIFKLCF